jgi:hypothetical protein
MPNDFFLKNQEYTEENFRNFQNQVWIYACQLAKHVHPNFNSLASTQTDIAKFWTF